MSTSDDAHLAFHRGTAPIFTLLTLEQTRQLAELRGDATIAARVTELAERANEGELTAAEQAEYEAYIEANDLLAVLQAGARFTLARREP